MISRITQGVLRASGWIRYGRRYESPLRPDRILRIDPHWIRRKPVRAPERDTLHPTLVVGGDWDRHLEPITDDIVYRAFHARFVEGARWDETGYVDFLQTDISEHGNVSREDAFGRCRKLDELHEYIRDHGYRTQSELARDEELIEGLSSPTLRPPAYREVSVDLTRDGEFVWHAGMHRLVIAQLLDIPEIPVRVNIRHQEWQDVRERAYRDGFAEDLELHPDIKYLIHD